MHPFIVGCISSQTCLIMTGELRGNVDSDSVSKIGRSTASTVVQQLP